jgi:putative ABC transport system permease protein
VVLTLALGLGAVGAMFAVVHGLLLAPLPYGQPERLVSLDLALADGSRLGAAPALHATYRRFATQVEDLALYRVGRANVGAGSDAGTAENLAVSWASASLMHVLQVPPQLGRTFTEDEDLRSGPQAVILSDAEWRRRFAASPAAIGRILVVNDVPREVVGVMPPGFAFPHAGVRMWLPAKPGNDTTAGDFFFTGVARLAPGATRESAQRELAAVLPRLGELYPQLASGGSTARWIAESKPVPRLQDLRAMLTAELAPTLWLLAAVAGLVLLVAWANVANLTWVRADAVARDVAVREALGAGALRARAPLVGESFLLGLAATVLAGFAVAAALSALRRFGPVDVPRLAELSLGPWTVMLMLGLAVLGSLAGGFALARRGALGGRLREGAHGASAGVARQRLRAGVAVLQVAAALVVLAGSALLLRTTHRLQQVDPGFNAARVTTFQILLPFARYGDAQRVAFHARLLDRVRALPSVDAAGLVAQLPLGTGARVEQDIRVEGETQTRRVAVNVASDGWLSTMGIPLLMGRAFSTLDAQRPDEVLISRQAAARFFADPRGQAALGRRLTLSPGGPTWTVIGVVGDVHQEDLATAPGPMLYRPQIVAALPATQPGPLPGMVLAVRSTGPEAPLVAAVREVVRELDPDVPVFEAVAMAEVVARSMARLHLLLVVIGAAAVVTLALGMLGLYGVLAFRVTQRTREFGLRMALGADAARITRSVIGGGLALVAIGSVMGLAVFAALAASLRAAVPGVQPWDPVSLLGAVLVLAATAALASWLPARRAAGVDPAQALRGE